MPLLYNRFSRQDGDIPGEKAQPLTLYQLNRRIGEALEDAFPESYWVVAEIAEVSRYASGHCYLTLVDKSNGSGSSANEQAKARATIWSTRYQRISQLFEGQTGHPLKPGLKILLNASVKFHELHGLSLDILHIDPNYTIGDLARQRQETIQRLHSEGLLDRNKEQVLPQVPQHLALISSATAAGLQDFLHQLQNNTYGYSFSTRLFPATVQGQEAVASVTNALTQIRKEYRQFNAVVIIRGGGSQTDLYCFDHYDIAAAVAEFPLPVLTGIGHERDETITDLVAHTRCKTPTAVAAFLIDRTRAFEEALEAAIWRIREGADAKIRNQKAQLERQSRELTQATNRYLGLRTTDLQELTQGIQNRQQVFVQEQRYILQCHQINLVHTTNQLLAQKKTALVAIKKDTRQACEHYLQFHQGQLLHLTHCVKGESRERLAKARLLLTQNNQRIYYLAKSRVSNEGHRLELREVKISLHDPQAMLLRGYTLTYHKGRLIKSMTELRAGDQIETRYLEGKTQSIITHTEPL
jgi:exodeoxyribonuclease VII large subunit